MSEHGNSAQMQTDADALRLVLFGMPHAGKSSLLGALAQAATAQQQLLNGKLTERSQGLAELQQNLYEGNPRETVSEIVTYAAEFESFARGGSRREIVFVDCDGRVANELLSRRRSLAEGSEKSLAGAIMAADALILVIDASANACEIEANFSEFVKFLRLLERSRGDRAAVGGLPVFLVLSKCDLLAQANDSTAAWMERIEDHKRQVGERFREFLDEEEEGPLPFGSIDLNLWATAVKRPGLADGAAQPREPYGVAELFRQCLDLAGAHQQRDVRSGRRLLLTVAGSLALVAGMVLLALGFLINRPEEQPDELLTKVDIYRSREGQTPSARLREPLQPKISELAELQADPSFKDLPSETQKYVDGRLQELRDYHAYKDRLQQVRAPALATSERELHEIETSVNDLTLPKDRQSEWSQTEAALFRAQRLKDIQLIRAAVTEMEDWYRRLSRRGEELWTFSQFGAGATGPIPWVHWNSQLAGLFDQAELLPHRPGDRLPGSSAVTYASVLNFDKVVEARTAWRGLRQRLQRVRDITAALGLAGKLAGRPALLEIPKPPGFTAAQAPARLQEMDKVYPGFQQDFSRRELPDVVVPEVERAARLSYQHTIEAGRDVVARHLADAGADGRESVESWRRLRPWLAAPQDLQAWRTLATTLARLQSPDGGDPLAALDAFVRQDRFDLELKHLTLEIPDDLKVRPSGNLSIRQRSGEENRPPLVFEVSGDSRHDARRRATAYSFRPLAGTSTVYRPGDLLWVELPVKDGDNDERLLTWARSRSQIYQFERFSHPPRLHRKDQENLDGKIGEGVTLTVLPERGVPAVPDLVPILPAEKR